MTKRAPDAELVDHYAGEMDWGFIAILLAVALGLVFLGVGIGLWYGDARGFARGHAGGVAVGEELERGTSLERQEQLHTLLKACTLELLELREGFNRHADQVQELEQECQGDFRWNHHRGLSEGWELGYRQAREDWEKPCLGR